MVDRVLNMALCPKFVVTCTVTSSNELFKAYWELLHMREFSGVFRVLEYSEAVPQSLLKSFIKILIEKLNVLYIYIYIYIYIKLQFTKVELFYNN